jgi:hypothetical protein
VPPHAKQAQGEGKVSALSILDSGAWGGLVSATPRIFYSGERGQVPIVQEAGWASVPVWVSPENVAHTGVRTPARPARSESPH